MRKSSSSVSSVPPPPPPPLTTSATLITVDPPSLAPPPPPAPPRQTASMRASKLLTRPSRVRVRIRVDGGDRRPRHGGSGPQPPRPEYHTIEVAVADLVARELEMHRVAAAYQVSGQRWNGSRLYNAYADHCLRREEERQASGGGAAGSRDPDGGGHPPLHPVVDLTLDPVAFCREHHLCRNLAWSRALTNLLAEFYATGLMQVGLVGVSFLLALEYFGILYQPDQLVFSSLQAYKLVKDWSDYLAQRSFMADWVAEQILRANGTSLDFYFATCAGTLRNRRTLDMIECERGFDPDLVWAFFNAPSTGLEMQQDFCYFLEHHLTMVKAEFVEHPAILHIRVVGRSFRGVTKSESMQRIHEENDGRDEKKCDAADPVAKTYSSPQHVADFDVVTDGDAYEASLAGMPSENALPAPKTLYDMAEYQTDHDKAVDAKGGRRRKRFTSKRPWQNDRQKLSSKTSETATHAPVSVIRARSTDITVQSALTGPFFYDGSVKKDVQAARGEALRQEWIQSSVLNRGLSSRIRALLDDNKSEEDNLEPSVDRCEQTTVDGNGDDDDVEDDDGDDDYGDDDDPLNDLNWNWINTVCDYPETLVQTGENLTSKMDISKLLESVEKAFSTSKTPAMTSEPLENQKTKTSHDPVGLSHVKGSRGVADARPQAMAMDTRITRKEPLIPDPTKGATRTTGTTRRIFEDFNDTCSYDGGLNFDSRLLYTRPSGRSHLTRSKQPIPQSTGRTGASSKSKAATHQRKGSRVDFAPSAKSGTSRKPFASIKRFFQRKKQYRV